MFIGREKELGQLNAELSSWKRKTAVLVYGKRRVGKSTLLSVAAKSFEGAEGFTLIDGKALYFNK